MVLKHHSSGNISHIRGNIFKSKCQTLVNAVNCRGTMGAGIARKFKRAFPAMYTDYFQMCERRELVPGKLHLWKNPEYQEPWVLNFPTKDHWKEPSKLEWIESGLNCLLLNYKNWGITSLAFPPLGTGLGGLTWLEVRSLLGTYLSRFEIPVEIYTPTLSLSERAIDDAIGDLAALCGQRLVRLELRRELYPKPSGWTDFKEADRLHIHITATEVLDENSLREIESKIQKKRKFLMTISQSLLGTTTMPAVLKEESDGS